MKNTAIAQQLIIVLSIGMACQAQAQLPGRGGSVGGMIAGAGSMSGQIGGTAAWADHSTAGASRAGELRDEARSSRLSAIGAAQGSVAGSLAAETRTSPAKAAVDDAGEDRQPGFFSSLFGSRAARADGQTAAEGAGSLTGGVAPPAPAAQATHASLDATGTAAQHSAAPATAQSSAQSSAHGSQRDAQTARGNAQVSVEVSVDSGASQRLANGAAQGAIQGARRATAAARDGAQAQVENTDSYVRKSASTARDTIRTGKQAAAHDADAAAGGAGGAATVQSSVRASGTVHVDAASM